MEFARPVAEVDFIVWKETPQKRVNLRVEVFGQCEWHRERYRIGVGRLAPLLIICKSKLAAVVAGEYLAERVSSRDFEKLADEAGLATPLVKRCVPALASSVREALKTAQMKDPVAAEVAKVIEQRCNEVLERFGR